MDNKLTKNDKRFINTVIQDLLKNHISIEIKYEKTLTNDDSPCTGTYGNKEFSLAYDNNKDVWLSVLIHEYNHFQQEKEKSSIWRKSERFKYKTYQSATDVFFNWLEGSRIPKKIAEKSCKIVQELEYDCEKRTFAMIQKYNLSVDSEWFIKKANSYIFWYSLAIKYRVWFDNKKPYEVDNMFKKLPNQFIDIKEYSNIPDHYEYHALLECTSNDKAFEKYLKKCK